LHQSWDRRRKLVAVESVLIVVVIVKKLLGVRQQIQLLVPTFLPNIPC
jgi:hypothetical protein